MHSMPARRIMASCADMVQSLDQTEHRDRLRRFRHLAQPGEPALVGFRPTLRQHIQPTTLVGREPVGQPALDLATQALSALGIEVTQRRDHGFPRLRIRCHRADDPGDRSRVIGIDQNIVLDVQQRAALQLAGQTPAIPEILVEP